jgi:hypothetical protein
VAARHVAQQLVNSSRARHIAEFWSVSERFKGYFSLE